MTENEIATEIVDSCYKIHVKLGPGLLESVYEKILIYELRKRGFHIEHQKALPVYYDNMKIAIGFKADLIVDSKVMVELKSVEAIKNVHKKQLLTYLKISGCKLGFLVNFNEAYIKNGITRIVNQL